MYNSVIYRRNRGRKFLLLLFIICFAVTLAYVYYQYAPEFLFSNNRNYDSIIKNTAKRHGIDSNLVRAVIWQESRFKPNVTGTKGEVGLMQIRPEKGAVTDWEQHFNTKISCRGVLFRPEVNIEIGTWYLSKAVKNWAGYKYQYELALSEYNAGRRGMKSWVPDTFDGEVVDNIKFASTKAYVRSIMNQFREYSRTSINTSKNREEAIPDEN